MKRRITVLITLVIVCAGIYGLRQIYVENSNPVFNDNAQTVNTHNVSPQKLFDKNWHVIRNEYYDSSFNDQHWNRWKEHYQNKIKTADDAKVATDTMLASLNDPYSRFMSKEEFAKQNNSISSKISGIGVSIINDSGKIRIINVIDQAPAQFAGLKSGDIITAVDGKKVSGLSLAEVSNLVKGLPNTIVTIEIQRRTEKIEKKIIRKEITIKTVKSTNYKDIGYIQISSFISSSTPNEFLEALENTINTKGLIIDLRGNSGGLLSNAVFIANLFINKGRLVSIVGREVYIGGFVTITDVNINKPIVILVDETSASASEILSGALKDYHKAKLVGTRTFGKGMVQKIIPMPNETGLNLTIAKYLTPAGHDINKKGISPDVEITLTKNDLDTKTDSQLEFAKNMLHTILAKGK